MLYSTKMLKNMFFYLFYASLILYTFLTPTHTPLNLIAHPLALIAHLISHLPSLTTPIIYIPSMLLVTITPQRVVAHHDGSAHVVLQQLLLVGAEQLAQHGEHPLHRA